MGAGDYFGQLSDVAVGIGEIASQFGEDFLLDGEAARDGLGLGRDGRSSLASGISRSKRAFLARQPSRITAGTVLRLARASMSASRPSAVAMSRCIAPSCSSRMAVSKSCNC